MTNPCDLLLTHYYHTIKHFLTSELLNELNRL
jgi:hypothetical protein